MQSSSALFGNGAKPFYGVEMPKLSGFKKLPPGYAPLSGAYDGSFAGTMIFFPLAVTDLQPILSVSIKGGGASDNGKKFRIALADNDGSYTVLKDWGEGTLTGSLAVQTITSTYTPTRIGLHWLTFHFKESSSHICMAPHVSDSAVGFALGLNMWNVLGEITPATNGICHPHAATKTVAYGAPGSTLAAPDGVYYGASTIGASATSGMGGVPSIWLGY